MEDFLVLQLLDLQLDSTKHQQVDKREVIAYIFLGDTCVDCLVLGSPSASLQDQKGLAGQNADSGGAANPNLFNQDENEERGSHVDEPNRTVLPSAQLQKRTKIPLAGLSHGPNNKGAPRTFQIVLRRIGTEKERFGSISFSLKRFQKATQQSFCHWVTLYDSLDDDLFEGVEGRDDDFDYPRVLLDYTIVSSKYTSMMVKADNLALGVDNARDKQNDQRENRSRASRKTTKATKMVQVSQTLEFVETRAAKLTGQRAPFEGRVMTEQQQEHYKLFKDDKIRDEQEATDRVQQKERAKQLDSLTKLIETYTVDNFRNEIQEDIEETKEESLYAQQAQNRQIQEVLKLVQEMDSQHDASLQQPIDDIINACFKAYGEKLESMEKKDISELKKRIGALKGMQNNLTRDLQDADRSKNSLLREREQLLLANNNPGEKKGNERLRGTVDYQMVRVEECKEDLTAQDAEMLQENADAMQPGNDKLYDENYARVHELYDAANTALQSQLNQQQNLAEVDQRRNDHKLQNMKLEEEIDNQIDQKIKLQQNSQRARKQIARMIRKTQTFLVDSEKLLKEKLLTVKSMNHEIHRLNKERSIVESKKKESFIAWRHAEDQRTEMMLHFSRQQEEKDSERQMIEAVREHRREQTVRLGGQITMMSTKAGNSDKFRDLPDEVKDESDTLNSVGRQLQYTQQKLMRALQEKDNAKARQLLAVSKGNIKGGAAGAREQLNSFTLQSEADVYEMQRELQSTQDKIRDLEKTTRQQDSRKRELGTSKSTTERRLGVVAGSVGDLQQKNAKNQKVDYVKDTKDLQKKNQETQYKVDKMLQQVQNKNRHQENQTNDAVRTALQKARRNINSMQKMANGIYKIKNKTQLVMVDHDGTTQEYNVSFTNEKGLVEVAPLDDFVKKI